MKIVKIYLKESLKPNFVFMVVVALIFGLISLSGVKDDVSFENFTRLQLQLNGYIFLFIIFATELSKEILQKEKINKKIEWFLANDIEIKSLVKIHSIVLFILTSLLLLPLIVITLIKIEKISLLPILTYYIYTFLCSIIIIREILFIKNMNRLKSIPLYIIGFVAVSKGIDIAVSIGLKNNLLGFLISVILALIFIFILGRKTDRERIVSAYF